MSISAIDYGVHGKIVEFTENTAEEIAQIIRYGCPTYKMFMIYKKEGVMSSDETLLDVFSLSKQCGGLPMLHCESDAIAERGLRQCGRDLSWVNFAQAKPVLCEVEAFSRAAVYAKLTGAPILVVHTTNKMCLDVARVYQGAGYPLYLETCPHYLVLDDSCYQDEFGYMAVCSPPLRAKEEQASLWQGIADGTISLIGSDDCSYSTREKSKYLDRDEKGKLIQDFTRIPGGISGLEIRLPLMLSEGVGAGRITINQLVAVTSTNVAKIYGCYPQKGVIAAGSDADIVVVDMEKEVTVRQEMLHNNVDHCMYEGMNLKGYPVMTISNGRIIVENNEFFGEQGRGRFVKRTIDPDVCAKFQRGGIRDENSCN